MRDKTDTRRDAEARIVDVTIEGAEKRREPRKHYVFCVTVAWADGTVNIIYRRYSHFYTLHSCLQNEFRLEAGSKKPSERILPFFPGRVMFGRTQKAAMKRQQPLDEYCKSLIQLPPHISRSPCVLQFFQPTEDDVIRSLKDPVNPKRSDRKQSVASVISSPIPVETYVAIAEFKSENKDQLSLEENTQVDVIDKNDTGWWLVSTDDGQGWVPSSYLECLDGDPDESDVIRFKNGQEEKYIAITEYLPSFDDELTLRKGVVVEVMEKTMDGWWLVRQGAAEGRAPATNLARADTVKAKKALDKSVPSTVQSNRLRKMSQGALADAMATDFHIPLSLQMSLPPRRRSVKAHYHRTVSKQSSIGVTYVAVADFFSTGAAMSLTEGDTMVMLEKMNNNWCLVELTHEDGQGVQTGWVPAAYIKPVVSPQASLDEETAPTVGDEEEYEYKLQNGYYNVPGSEESSSRFSDVASSVGANSLGSSGLDSPTAMSTTDSDASGPQLTNKTPGHGENKQESSSGRNTRWRESESGSEYSTEASNAGGESPSTGSMQSPVFSDDTENKNLNSQFVSPVWGPADAVEEEEDTTVYPIYMARSNFTGKGTNETNLEQGEMVKVIEKSGQGWWLVRGQAGQGVVPSHFLRIPPSDTPAPTQPTFPTATLLAPYRPKHLPSNIKYSPSKTDSEPNGPMDGETSPKSVNELLKMFNKV